MIGGEWHATFVESFILVKTQEGWKIAFGHTSQLPADFGAEPDYRAAHGGMKLVKVPEDGPAGKAGFKSGDVLIEYGGRKIDNYIDYSRLTHAYSEGEKVSHGDAGAGENHEGSDPGGDEVSAKQWVGA